MKLRQSLLKFVSPSTPKDERLKTAKREETGVLEPADELTVIFVLGFDKDAEISQAARRSFQEYPADAMLEALDSTLDPLVIKKVLESRGDNEAVMIMAAMNPGTDDDTLRRLAESGPEEVILTLAEDKGLLSGKPFLIESLGANPLTPNSVRDALRDFKPVEAKGGAVASEKLSKDLTDEKRAKADEQNIFKLVSQLNAGQKLKLAITGNKSARELLIKDSNKIIAISVLKNPRISEEEVQRLTQSKGTSDELLRFIGRNKEWVKNYSIRIGMLSNPKTPLQISLKLLDTVYEKDLQAISKSKNIPSVLASTARRKLEAKKS